MHPYNGFSGIFKLFQKGSAKVQNVMMYLTAYVSLQVKKQEGSVLTQRTRQSRQSPCQSQAPLKHPGGLCQAPGKLSDRLLYHDQHLCKSSNQCSNSLSSSGNPRQSLRLSQSQFTSLSPDQWRRLNRHLPFIWQQLLVTKLLRLCRRSEQPCQLLGLRWLQSARRQMPTPP